MPPEVFGPKLENLVERLEQQEPDPTLQNKKKLISAVGMFFLYRFENSVMNDQQRNHTLFETIRGR